MSVFRSFSFSRLRHGARALLCVLGAGVAMGADDAVAGRLAKAQKLLDGGELAQARALVEALAQFHPDDAQVKAFREQLAGAAKDGAAAGATLSAEVKQAAEAGDLAALRRVHAYQQKHGTLAERLLWLERLAKAGDSDAAREMAQRLIEGRGLTKDLAKAEEWFRQAAWDAPTGAYMLEFGEAYLAGVFPKRNFSHLCVTLLTDDANGGQARAQFIAARLILDGVAEMGEKWRWGTLQQAATWLLGAAKQGEREAFLPLAECYRLGRGTQKDPAQAAVWYRKSLDVVTPEERLAIALRFINGDGVTRDVPAALEIVRKTTKAKTGLREANYALGLAYKTGAGIERSALKASQHFYEADTHPPALYELALAWRDGNAFNAFDRPKRDYHEALKYMQRAADAGHAPAQAGLAEMKQRAARFHRVDEFAGSVELIIYSDSPLNSAGRPYGRLIYDGYVNDRIWLSADKDSVLVTGVGNPKPGDPLRGKMNGNGRFISEVSWPERLTSSRTLQIDANIEVANTPGKFWTESSVTGRVQANHTAIRTIQTTSSEPETYEAEVESTQFRPTLTVQTILNGAHTAAGSDSNGGSASTAKVQFQVPAGRTFRMEISSKTSSGGDYVLRMRRLVPLTKKGRFE